MISIHMIWNDINDSTAEIAGIRYRSGSPAELVGEHGIRLLQPRILLREFGELGFHACGAVIREIAFLLGNCQFCPGIEQ